ncbi:MAG: alpha/beta hydrolase, partial [Deltaproteobacteria bacterium]
MERGIVFFPEREIYQTPKDVGLSYEDVYFPAADGVRLHGWFVPGERDTLLVWFHGNAGNIADRVDNLGLLVRKTGVSVFLFDYREYGLSQGRVSKAGTFSDAEGVYRYLTEERGVPPEKMVLFGRSLGSALAVYLAATRPVGALIVESAFTSSEDVANLYYP